MSTPPTADDVENEPQGEARNGFFLRAMRVFAGLSAAVALYALWSVERVDLDCDLQLAAPPEVRPGEPFALRALAFCDLDAVEGPRLVSPPVAVAQQDTQGRELIGTPRAQLNETKLETLDGTTTSDGPEGERILVATAIHEGIPLTVRRALQVRKRAAAERVLPREVGPLQQYSLGRVHTLGTEPPPDRLLPRVVGGACAPEVPCTIVLWVGAPAASVVVRGASVSVESAPDPREREGLVTFVVRVNGPEAELTFEARRAGVAVAERALRLPIALGEVAITGGLSLSPRRAEYAIALPPGRSAVTIDVFRDGRWSETHVSSDARFSLEAPSAPALVRVQARSDRFSSDGAGARLVYVRGNLGEAQALRELARLMAAQASPFDEPPVSALWAEQLPAFAQEDVQATAAFLLAPAESLRAQIPAPVSGRPAQLARLERTKVRMRYGVAGALALSAWLIALSVARRGLLAVDQAQGILDEARDEADDRRSARERINARAKVLLMGLAVAAAFLAGALLIAAKSLWF